MSVLIRFETGSGVKRRCDARCYNAKHKNCKCICNGSNHSIGLTKAILNTEDISKHVPEFEYPSIQTTL